MNYQQEDKLTKYFNIVLASLIFTVNLEATETSPIDLRNNQLEAEIQKCEQKINTIAFSLNNTRLYV